MEGDEEDLPELTSEPQVFSDFDPESSSDVSEPSFTSGSPNPEVSGSDPKVHASDVSQIREFSERAAMRATTTEAAYPFSLLIEGPLDAAEKSKLQDFLNQEAIGIRPSDLEAQLEAQKVLIPQISEFAGIRLVQILRASRAIMQLAPSSEVYTASSTQDEENPILELESKGKTQARSHFHEGKNPAEYIPLVSGSPREDPRTWEVIDSLTATATLKTSLVDAKESTEYQELLDSLQRELKYKAYRRGATAIVKFQIILTPLDSSHHYRLLATGVAIKQLS